ncbi:MAG: GNAT family N-acetyltransferase [Vicinamibacterales bacterium]
MNDDVTLSIRQMDGAWRLMCAGGPKYAAESSGDIQYIFSGVPISFFNIALLTGDRIAADALGALGRQACAWAGPRSVPWLFMVTHEGLEPGVDATATLDACGLAPVMPMTAMVARTIGPALTAPDLQLTVPQDDSGCAAILDINSLAYGMDLEAGKPTLGTRAFWKDQFPVVGVVDEKPVSSATVLMVDGHRYVALVATDPSQQRRGFADATMRQALANAATVHGQIPTVLHATDAGRPVYARMGYKDIATHTLFMEKRFLEEH